MTKRVYGRGNARHSEQYNSYVSKPDFERLEELRVKVAHKKGKRPEDFSRGSFLMWMYRKCYTELDDGIPLEDFCDNQISELEELTSRIQTIIDKTNRFKEDAMRYEDGEEEAEQDNENCILVGSDSESDNDDV